MIPNKLAVLFSHAKNINEGAEENRVLIMDLHTACDVYCSDCGEQLGWKYLKASEATQNYKVGKSF